MWSFNEEKDTLWPCRLASVDECAWSTRIPSHSVLVSWFNCSNIPFATVVKSTIREWKDGLESEKNSDDPDKLIAIKEAKNWIRSEKSSRSASKKEGKSSKKGKNAPKGVEKEKTSTMRRGIKRKREEEEPSSTTTPNQGKKRKKNIIGETAEERKYKIMRKLGLFPPDGSPFCR
eukprot:TRINITY_DN2156_c0_g1_i23.p1 TRINITY_DN2156_c0_g1~~TRINITY_DN2156_c0_g1_i23.p1  ORF type:complete len:175 (+),score=40.67 TRINITY_DN2156_c0_g1_i23:108-632(+)